MNSSDTTNWPNIRASVEVLSDHWPEWLLSRVEDMDDHHLMLAAPTTPTIPVLFADPGDSVRVQWTCHRGVCEITARVDKCKRAPAPIWVITATSKPVVSQRRKFARIPISLPVILALGDEAEENIHTLNIGEGGISCVMAKDHPPIAEGDEVVVMINFDGDAFSSKAICLRGEKAEDGKITTSFRFAQLDRGQADRIRRFIFNEELRRRARRVEPRT